MPIHFFSKDFRKWGCHSMIHNFESGLTKDHFSSISEQKILPNNVIFFSLKKNMHADVFCLFFSLLQFTKLCMEIQTFKSVKIVCMIKNKD
jgi:hypothetical protein